MEIQYHFILKILFVKVLLLQFFPSPLKAQQSNIKNVQIFYNPKAIPELFNRVEIGLRFNYLDGTTGETRGLMNGKIPWKKIRITTEHGTVTDGVLVFDRKALRAHHQAVFDIRFENQSFQADLELPYIEKIRFNLYRDSLISGIPFSLNVEGYFSSGKVYPVAGRNLEFTTSKGEVEDGMLHYSGPEKDAIFLTVRLKDQPKLEDSIRVPIKLHVEEVHLPTEKELFDQWKTRRRKNQ